MECHGRSMCVLMSRSSRLGLVALWNGYRKTIVQNSQHEKINKKSHGWVEEENFK